MYWRQSIPLLGGLKYNRTSNGKDYISYRKNGMYIREPVADLKKDIKNLFHPGQRTLDVNEVQKKIKDSFNSYNDGEILNQVELLKQFNVSYDDIADVVASSIFDGSVLTTDQLNHAKGIFSHIKCSKSKKSEIEKFIEDGLTQSQNKLPPPIHTNSINNNQQIPSNTQQHIPVAPEKKQNNNIPTSPNPQPVKPVNTKSKDYAVAVDIFREDNGQFNKVTSGQCKVENNQVIISANVTKSFAINEILEIYKKNGKLFIYIKNRKQPFILFSNDIDDLLDNISNLFCKK